MDKSFEAKEPLFMAGYWLGRRLPFGEYIYRSSEYMSQISINSSSVENWMAFDASGQLVELPRKYDERKRVLKELIYDDNVWYLDSEGRRYGELSDELAPAEGFHQQYVSCRKIKDGALDLSIDAGGHVAVTPEGQEYGGKIPNRVFLKFPQYLHEEYYQFDFVKKLVKLTVESWMPHGLSVSSHDFVDAVGVDYKSSPCSPGWFLYIDRKIEADDVRGIDVSYEILPQGTLFWISDEPVSSKNAVDVRKGKDLFLTLKERNLLGWG